MLCGQKSGCEREKRRKTKSRVEERDLREFESPGSGSVMQNNTEETEREKEGTRWRLQEGCWVGRRVNDISEWKGKGEFSPSKFEGENGVVEVSDSSLS